MRGFVLFAAACVVAIALAGAIGWSFTGQAGHRAMLASAGVALVTQLAAFGVARGLIRRNLLLGWGLGSVLRLLVLGGYALVVARVSQAPAAPALLSFVGFLFLTMIFEPVFLKQ